MGQDGATMQMLKFQLKELPSFADYLREGWQVVSTIGIDFTASNGNAKSKMSSHFFGPTN
jgi:hypothetical protein